MALGTESVLIDGLKERKVSEMDAHPVVKVLDIGDGIDDASGTENVGILG